MLSCNLFYVLEGIVSYGFSFLTWTSGERGSVPKPLPAVHRRYRPSSRATETSRRARIRIGAKFCDVCCRGAPILRSAYT